MINLNKIKDPDCKKVLEQLEDSINELIDDDLLDGKALSAAAFIMIASCTSEQFKLLTLHFVETYGTTFMDAVEEAEKVLNGRLH